MHTVRFSSLFFTFSVPASNLRKALSAADIPFLVNDLSGNYFPIRERNFSGTAWCRKEFGMSCFGNAQYFRKNNTYASIQQIAGLFHV
jgi:hypothetical protein